MNSNNNSNIRTLSDMANDVPLSNSVSTSVFNNSIGQTLSDNFPALTQNDETLIRDAFDLFNEENKKFIEENGSSSYAESFPDLIDNNELAEFLDLPPLTYEGVFDTVRSLYSDINNGLLDLGSNPMSISIIKLIQERSSNNPLLQTASNILNSNTLNESVLYRLSQDQWRDVTVGEIFDTIRNLPLDLVPALEIGIEPVKLISLGITYNMLMRGHIKLMSMHTREMSQIPNPFDKFHFLKNRMAINCIMGGLVIPFASVIISNFNQSSIFKALSHKVATISGSNFKISPPLRGGEDLSYIPLLLSNGLKKKIPVINPEPPFGMGKNRAGLPNGKWNNFFKRGLKWIIILLLAYLQLKYNYLKTISTFISNNEKIINAVLIYIGILSICASLVLNTIAVLIFSIENEIKMDTSKIRIKFIRDFIGNFIVVKNTSKGKIDFEKIKQDHIFFLKITLFAILALPFIYEMSM